MARLSAETIAELGGKTGLLRRFVDDATTYVWQTTGVKPEQALTILRSLRSAAGTNEAKTANEIHTLYPQFPQAQIRSVLDAFSEQYIVERVPRENQPDNDLPYEFLHEQMIAALEESPSPDLLRLKDKEVRRKFWTERTATTLAPLPKKASFAEHLGHTFAAPIPLWEAASLWRGASVEDKKALRQNQLGWLKRYGVTVAVLGAPTGIYYSYTNTWTCQMGIITEDVKSTSLESVDSKISDEYLKLLVWNGYVTQALKTAESIKDDIYGSRALISVAKALEKVGKASEAADAWTKALKAAESIKDDIYGSRALISVAETLAKAGKASEALKVAESIKDDNARSITLISVAEALEKAGKAGEAADALTKALRVAESIKDDIIGSRTSALASVAEALAKAGKASEALKAAESIKDDIIGSRTSALISVAEALAKVGKASEAADALTKALKAAESIKDDIIGYRTRALASVAEALAKAGKASEAIKVAESIKGNVYGSHALISLAETLAKAGKASEALKVAESIKDDNTRSRALISVAEALAKAGKASEAADALTKALKAAESIKDDITGSRSGALASAAEALAKAGKASEALKVAENIKDDYYRSGALISVAEALAKAGKASEAADALTKALKAAESIKDDITGSSASPMASVAEALARESKAGSSASALANVAEALAKAGKASEAADALTKALKAAESIKDDQYGSRSGALASAAEALAKVGKASEAIKVAGSIKDDNARSITLISMVEALAKVGKASEAIKVAESIKDDNTRSRALTSVADALEKNEITKQLPEMRQSAFNAATGSGTAVAQWTAFASKCSTLLGQEKRAQEEATSIKDLSSRLDAYNFLMREHLKRTNPKFKAVWEAGQKEKKESNI